MNAAGMTCADGSAILNFSGVADAAVIGVPQFFLCKFNITAILAMAPIAIASMMEHVGDISASPQLLVKTLSKIRDFTAHCLVMVLQLLSPL